MKKQIPTLQKPIKPVRPDPSDKVKYPYPPTKTVENHVGVMIYDSNPNYILDCKKYDKDFAKYVKDLEEYEQLKLIRLLKVANEKLILKKYKIIHRSL